MESKTPLGSVRGFSRSGCLTLETECRAFQAIWPGPSQRFAQDHFWIMRDPGVIRIEHFAGMATPTWTSSQTPIAFGVESWNACYCALLACHFDRLFRSAPAAECYHP